MTATLDSLSMRRGCRKSVLAYQLSVQAALQTRGKSKQNASLWPIRCLDLHGGGGWVRSRRQEYVQQKGIRPHVGYFMQDLTYPRVFYGRSKSHS